MGERGFIFTAGKYSIVWMNHNSLIHSPADGWYLGCCPFFSITNNSARNNLSHSSWYTCLSFTETTVLKCDPRIHWGPSTLCGGSWNQHYFHIILPLILSGTCWAGFRRLHDISTIFRKGYLKYSSLFKLCICVRLSFIKQDNLEICKT